MKNFDIFRINCWLEDLDGNNFNNSIKSLVYDILHARNNELISVYEVYNHIRKDLDINLEKDYFEGILLDDENLNSFPTDHSNSLIKLTSKKFSEITSNIQKNSLESHVRKFPDFRTGTPRLKSEYFLY